MLAEKLLPVLVIDEGFGSTRSGGGERSGQISSSEAGRQISTTNVLREESRIVAVSVADSIHYGHIDGGTTESLMAMLCDRGVSPERQNHDGNDWCSFSVVLVEIICCRHSS